MYKIQIYTAKRQNLLTNKSGFDMILVLGGLRAARFLCRSGGTGVLHFSCFGKKSTKRSRHRGGVLTRAPAPVNTLPYVPLPCALTIACSTLTGVAEVRSNDHRLALWRCPCEQKKYRSSGSSGGGQQFVGCSAWRIGCRPMPTWNDPWLLLLLSR